MAQFTNSFLSIILLLMVIAIEATPPGIANNPSHATCKIKKYKLCYNLVHVCPKFCPNSCTVECASCKPICTNGSTPPPQDGSDSPPDSPPESKSPTTTPSSPSPPTTTPSSPSGPSPPTVTPSSPSPPYTTPSSPSPPTSRPSSPSPPNTTPSSPSPPTSKPSSPSTPDTTPSPPSPTTSTPSSPLPPTPTPSSPSPPDTTPSSPSPPDTTPSPSPPTSTPSSPSPPTSTPSSPSPRTSTPSSPSPPDTTPSSPSPPTSKPSSPSPPTPTPSSPSPPDTTPSSPSPPNSKPSYPPPSRKTAKCRNKYYPQCYNSEHVCPSSCPGGCEVDCVTCKPVCKCDRPGAVCQDPRFIGGDGITFYFHGKKDRDFCLVSDPNLHINAHFIGKRNENMTRDFTWVQSIAILFDKHQIFLAALKTATWEDSIDRLALSFNGQPLTLPQNEGSTWQSGNANGLSITRIGDTNNVEVEVEGKFKITAKVVPITEEDSRIHNYGITKDDCFAHLDLGFKFYSLSDQVNGVLGETYRPGYVSRINVGAKMPVIGGDKDFETSSIFAADCAVAQFNNGNRLDGDMQGFEFPSLSCASGIDGQGVVCKR
ncbi:hypothetical protein JCGZ_22130 [Jatropha curcas]|uniref:Uncharacterized protein n=1 Tax=Jatropha curcas TaxID=180498 RepID=A0A067LR95_JATCU|nr:hypothetical protein JCGZ_22130 [Jatropha curcas]